MTFSHLVEVLVEYRTLISKIAIFTERNLGPGPLVPIRKRTHFLAARVLRLEPRTN